MRMSKNIKSTIHEAILSDMPPLTNYDEQMQDIVWRDSFLQLPQQLRDAIDRNKDVRSYLDVKHIRVPDCTCLYLRSYGNYEMTDHCRKEVIRLHALRDKEVEERRDIKRNLWAIIDSCPTVAQFVKSYPEFEKYVPKDGQSIRKLPAIDLIKKMKRAGWKVG